MKSQHVWKKKLGNSLVSSFSDGETRVELGENIRGKDVYIIQSTSFPANHHIMEAAILADACKRASAAGVTLVAPYFGYARQERKNTPRSPISAKVVAEILETAGVNRLLTMELHNSAIQGFFRIPVDHLFMSPVFSRCVEFSSSQMVIVSPDAGGVERAREMAKHYKCSLAIIDKRREKPNDVSLMNVIGEIAGKHCLLVDDIVDTAGSLVKATAALEEKGAQSVSAAVAHGVLSGDALKKINTSSLKQLFITDTIDLNEKAKECRKLEVTSVASLFAEAIRRIHYKESISFLCRP